MCGETASCHSVRIISTPEQKAAIAKALESSDGKAQHVKIAGRAVQEAMESSATALDAMGLDIIKRARDFAADAHNGQKYGDEPYIFHPEKVRSILLWMGVDDPELHAAALLHDVLEDTPVKYHSIREAFGMRVAEAVYAVTDELGRNRHERRQKTLPKTAASADGRILKLADRIANVEHSVKTGNERMLALYRNEQPEFQSAIARFGDDRFMAYLDGLLVPAEPGQRPPLREGA